jgi:CheY-like chemotaxis protein
MNSSGLNTDDESATVCLIVEDEPAILRLIVLALHDLGCVALPAPSAEAALQMLENERVSPAITITDVRLPGMDGVELTRLIKADSRLSDKPVILMSAYGEPRQHQGDAFLAKPFDIDELGMLVEAHLPNSG